MPYVPTVNPLLPVLATGPTPEAVAFQIVMDALADATSLIEINTKIVTYSSGADESAKNKPAPNLEDMPYVRTSLRVCNSAMETERSHKVIMVFHFEMFVAGLSEQDILNLADRVRRAFYPSDQDAFVGIQSSIHANASGRTRITVQSSAVGSIGESEHGLKSSLDLTLTLLVRT